jgi:hypothetical protein
MTIGHFEEKQKMPLAYDSRIIAAFPLEASSDGELLQPPLRRPRPQCFNN